MASTVNHQMAGLHGQDAGTPSNPRQRSFLKCDYCRGKKRKCEPEDRTWPGQKCWPCIRGGQPCGPNKLHDRLPRPSMPEAFPPSQIDYPLDMSFMDDASPFTTVEPWQEQVCDSTVPMDVTPRTVRRGPSNTLNRPTVSAAPVKPRDSIRARLKDLNSLCTTYTCLEHQYRASVSVQPARRFHSYADVESCLSTILHSAVNDFDHLCDNLIRQILPLSSGLEKEIFLQRLFRITERMLQVSSEGVDLEENGNTRIAAWHIKVIEELIKLYEDPSEACHDPTEADYLRIAVARTRRHNLNVPASNESQELESEAKSFQHMADRACQTYADLKAKIPARWTRLLSDSKKPFPPAHVAVYFQRPDTARLLLQQAWNKPEKDLLHRGILHIAAGVGDLKLLETVLGTAPRDERDIFEMTPLCMAANRGDLHVFKALAEAGHSLKDRDVESRSVLCIAAGAGSKDIVVHMLQQGCNPNPYNLEQGQLDNAEPSHAYSPLHAAAAGGYMDIVRLLLQKKALAFWVSNDCTPSKEAAFFKHDAVAKVLKEAETAQDRDLEEAKAIEANVKRAKLMDSPAARSKMPATTYMSGLRQLASVTSPGQIQLQRFMSHAPLTSSAHPSPQLSEASYSSGHRTSLLKRPYPQSDTPSTTAGSEFGSSYEEISSQPNIDSQRSM